MAPDPTTNGKQQAANDQSAGKRGIRPQPMEVCPGEDNHVKWTNFQEGLGDYALMEGLYRQEPVMQVAAFRSCFGENNRPLLRNLGLGPIRENDKADKSGRKPCATLEYIMNEIEKHFQRHDNIQYKRYVFRNITQTAGETIDDFFDRALTAVKHCNYGKGEAEMLKDQMILGTTLEKAREWIFRDSSSYQSLDAVLMILRQEEGNDKYLQDINYLSSGTQSEETVHKAFNSRSKHQRSDNRARKKH